jgi:hypothetical protein
VYTIVKNEKENQEYKQSVTKKQKCQAEFDMISNLTKPSFLNSCCLLNKNENSNCATCNHIIKGQCVKLTGALKQNKLKWYQDCLIKDETGTMNAYFGDEPLTNFLGMNCIEAKQLHSNAKNSSSPTASNEFIRFNECVESCQIIFASIAECSMHLRYDLEKAKYCIFKLENIVYK